MTNDAAHPKGSAPRSCTRSLPTCARYDGVTVSEIQDGPSTSAAASGLDRHIQSVCRA